MSPSNTLTWDTLAEKMGSDCLDLPFSQDLKLFECEYKRDTYFQILHEKVHYAKFSFTKEPGSDSVVLRLKESPKNFSEFDSEELLIILGAMEKADLIRIKNIGSATFVKISADYSEKIKFNQSLSRDSSYSCVEPERFFDCSQLSKGYWRDNHSAEIILTVPVLSFAEFVDNSVRLVHNPAGSFCTKPYSYKVELAPLNIVSSHIFKAKNNVMSLRSCPQFRHQRLEFNRMEFEWDKWNEDD